MKTSKKIKSILDGKGLSAKNRSRSTPISYICTSLICSAFLPLSVLLATIICYVTPDPLSSIGKMALVAYVLWGAICGIVIRIRHILSSIAGRMIPLILSSLVIALFSLVYSGTVSSALLMNLLCYILIGAFICMGDRIFKRQRRHSSYSR
jgi:hypothetical protein